MMKNKEKMMKNKGKITQNDAEELT
jgi:hypothetical protein